MPDAPRKGCFDILVPAGLLVITVVLDWRLVLAVVLLVIVLLMK